MNFTVIEQHRHKYRCTKCHGDLKTTPLPPRILAGSSYSDELIVDAAAAYVRRRTHCGTSSAEVARGRRA